MKIAIIGSGIEVFSCAHTLLDIDSNFDLHIFDEKAESGMYGEEPGLFSEWPIVPISWNSNLFEQKPNDKSSAIRYSWFVKSLSIAIAQRGVNLHLKTIVKNIEGNKIEFYGAGYLGMGQMSFEKIIDFRKETVGKLWYGGVTISDTKIEIFGVRPDQTMEIWSQEENIGENLIQKMEWYGTDPRTALSDRVKIGIKTAESLFQR